MQTLTKTILGALSALSLSTPAFSQAYYHNGVVVGTYANPNGGSAASSVNSDMPPAPGHSAAQVQDARRQAQKAYRQCLIQGTGINVAGNLVNRGVDKLLGNRFGSYYNNSSYGLTYQCEGLRQQIYADLMTVRPEAWCERVMTSERRRDGSMVEAEKVSERCGSNRAEDWDTALRYPQ